MPGMVANYGKCGFTTVGRSVFRYHVLAGDMLKIMEGQSTTDGTKITEIKNPDESLFKKLCNYDKEVTRRDRSTFLRQFVDFHEVIVFEFRSPKD